MAHWIEVKARYEKTLENGTIKKVNESYLVDALTCAEAEARLIKELTPCTGGDISVLSNKKINISEVFIQYIGERLYKVKVNFITINEKTASEIKTASYIIVPADDFKQAYVNFENGMKGTPADYEIESIAETRYIEVYKYDVENDAAR